MYFGIGAIIATCGTILIEGIAGLYCLVGISAFMSLMFPSIYGIALEEVKAEDTTLGNGKSAFLPKGTVLRDYHIYHSKEMS